MKHKPQALQCREMFCARLADYPELNYKLVLANSAIDWSEIDLPLTLHF